MEEKKRKKWSALKTDTFMCHLIITLFIVTLQLVAIDQALLAHSTLCVVIDAVLIVVWIVMMAICCKYNYEQRVVKFLRVHDDASVPNKRDGDAGYDIYARFNDDYIFIAPHQTKMIPTGIASAFDKRYVAILKERGSTGVRGMGQRAGVIDSSYRGEWFVPITNHNDKPLVICKKECEDSFTDKDVVIYPYDKAICQVIFVPNPRLDIVELDQDTYHDIALESTRGEGALGSSGK